MYSCSNINAKSVGHLVWCEVIVDPTKTLIESEFARRVLPVASVCGCNRRFANLFHGLISNSVAGHFYIIVNVDSRVLNHGVEAKNCMEQVPILLTFEVAQFASDVERNSLASFTARTSSTSTMTSTTSGLFEDGCAG